jgi:flagellar assembly factor FliW
MSNTAMTLEEPTSLAAESLALPVIDFVAAMPGFPDNRHFVLVQLEETGLLFALTSIETPGLRFLVVPPAPFFPDYAPEIDDETLALLTPRTENGGTGESDPANLLVLLVVTTADTADQVTANLMAPVVVNRETRRAVQLVLNRTALPVRERLMSAV